MYMYMYMYMCLTHTNACISQGQELLNHLKDAMAHQPVLLVRGESCTHNIYTFTHNIHAYTRK